MTSSSPSAFAGFRFPREVISVAVRWYLRYGLSCRDVEELLAELAHTRRVRAEPTAQAADSALMEDHSASFFGSCHPLEGRAVDSAWW